MHDTSVVLVCCMLLAVAAEGYPLPPQGPVLESPSDPALDLRAAVTLEAWVRAQPQPQAGARLIDRHESGTNNGYLLDTHPGNSLRLITSNGAVSYAAGLDASRWWHVVGVYDAAARVQKLYVDGQEVAAKTDGEFPQLTVRDLPLRLGADQGGGTRLRGDMARAAVYGRALTAAEIAGRATAGPQAAATLPGAVGDWLLADDLKLPVRSQTGALTLTRGGETVELTGQASPPLKPLVAWYRQPASEWVEATPLGNGLLGAMVFGGVARERIALNEGTFWAGGPYQPGDKDTIAGWREAQRLVAAGQYRAADDLINDQLMGNPSRQMSYQPIGDAILTFPGGPEASDYRRELDLDLGLTRTTFVRDGVRFVRETFTSAPDGVLVMRITADQPGALNFTLGLRTPQEGSSAVEMGDLILRGEGPDYRGIEGRGAFETRARLEPSGGQLTAGEASLKVTGADSCVLMLAIGTNYRDWRNVDLDPAVRPREAIERAARRGWNDLRARHIADHQRLFRRVSLELPSSGREDLPTDERLIAARQEDDPGLAALYFQFGRYLLASCSRPGGQAATLQGLWNESTNPPWDSKYTININTEMNYWPAQSANLGETVAPLAQMLSEMAVSGRVTAERMFGARGWVCFHNTDGWRATAPIDGPWAYTPTCGAWLSMALWDRWQYGGDRAELAAAYALWREAALFFLDTLIVEPRTGWLVTSPSASPEIRHAPAGANVSAGPAMDSQILRDLFDRAAAAAEILGVDADLAAEFRAARARLAPDQIGAQGQLQEFLEDWDNNPGADVHHRHVSHLYALYPSGQIDPLTTPELAAAARQSLETRGDEATGWSLGWKINLWARLLDGDRAHKLVRMLLDPTRTYPNLFDAHPPFQIDGNFGGVSGIVEMLLQSHRQRGDAYILDFLPALPTAWADGAVRGLRARGGLTVDLSWAAGAVTEVTLVADRPGEWVLRAGDAERTVRLKAGERFVWRGE